MKRTLIPLVVWLAAAPPARALLEVEGYYWLMFPSGDAQVSSGAFEGTRVDLEDDFGYDDGEDVFGVRAVVGNMHQIGIDAFFLDVSADNRVDRPIQFSNLLFPSGFDVSSELEATFVRGFYRLNVGSDTVRGGLTLGGQYITFDAEASSPLVGSASESAEAGTPIVGGQIALRPLEYVYLRASVVGFDWDFGDIEAFFLDFDVSATAVIPPGFMVGAGFRLIDVDGEFDDEDIELDATLSGPIFFAGFEW